MSGLNKLRRFSPRSSEDRVISSTHHIELIASTHMASGRLKICIFGLPKLFSIAVDGMPINVFQGAKHVFFFFGQRGSNTCGSRHLDLHLQHVCTLLKPFCIVTYIKTYVYIYICVCMYVYIYSEIKLQMLGFGATRTYWNCKDRNQSKISRPRVARNQVRAIEEVHSSSSKSSYPSVFPKLEFLWIRIPYIII